MSFSLQASSYLPPIQFFIEIATTNSVCIEAHENYTKQSYRNRCEIYGANGKLPLCIPIHKNRVGRTKIKDAKINYSDRWQKVHWKSLESAYRRSPFFEYYEHEFVAFYNSKKHTFLFDYNLELLNKTLQLIGMNPEISFTEEYIKSPKNITADLRNIDPKDRDSEAENYTRYIQVFEDKKGFSPNLSIVDLLFNEGPNSSTYLKTNG